MPASALRTQSVHALYILQTSYKKQFIKKASGLYRGGNEQFRGLRIACLSWFTRTELHNKMIKQLCQTLENTMNGHMFAH